MNKMTCFVLTSLFMLIVSTAQAGSNASAPKNGADEIEGVEKDLEIKIQNLTSQLSEAREKLKELRGTVAL